MTHFPSPLGPSIRPLLKRIGLDEREIEVYLALLPMKIGRASAIAKAAKQSRSHTYLVLQSLEARGLVSQVERGSVLHFVAEPPQRLVTYVRGREEELKQTAQLAEGALPYLKSLTSPLVGAPKVTMLQGIDGMKQVYRDALLSDFCALFNPEAMYRSFGRNVVTMVPGKDACLRGRDLIVDNEESKRYLRETPQHEHYEIRLLPKGTVFQTDTIVAADTLWLFAYDDEKTIIKIENQNLADSFRAWFEMLWKTGGKTK